MLSWPRPTGSLETQIALVHAWALSVFVWTADIESWGVPEHWPLRSELERHARDNAGVVKDDCDGFAVLCRCALWDLGIPSRILVCNVEPSAALPAAGGNHAVLSPEGTGLVMDCRYRVVVSREELERIGYQWVAMSGPNPGDPWTEVKT